MTYNKTYHACALYILGRISSAERIPPFRVAKFSYFKTKTWTKIHDNNANSNFVMLINESHVLGLKRSFKCVVLAGSFIFVYATYVRCSLMTLG